MNPNPNKPGNRPIVRAEKIPPMKAARRAGRQTRGVEAGRVSSLGRSTRTTGSTGSGGTKRICGARQPAQNGVPTVTAKPHLGQEWSTSAKLQERASQQQETANSDGAVVVGTSVNIDEGEFSAFAFGSNRDHVGIVVRAHFEFHGVAFAVAAAAELIAVIRFVV